MPVESKTLLPRGFPLKAVDIGVFDGNGFAALFADHMAAMISHGLMAGTSISMVNASGNACPVKVFDRSVDG